MLRGGISEPRNKTMLKIFNLIGVGEHAGSEVPDRTKLILPLAHSINNELERSFERSLSEVLSEKDK